MGRSFSHNRAHFLSSGSGTSDRQIPQATIGGMINLTAEAHNAGSISLESTKK
jgi:hypothetical protein